MVFMKIYDRSSLVIQRFRLSLSRAFAVLFWSGCLVAPLSVASAASIKRSTYYTPPEKIGCRKDVVADFNAVQTAGGRQNERFQRAINEVAKCEGGGILNVPRGRYVLRGIELKSNVHLRVDQGAFFFPSNNDAHQGVSIFHLAINQEQGIENVSIVGKGSGFTFDLRTGGELESAIRVGDVSNFNLANFRIKDRQTLRSSIAFTMNNRNDKYYWGRNGIVEHVHQENADIGYGLIQIHALTNVFFDDISTEGGVALRIEPDTPMIRASGRGGARKIVARNVGCSDGLAAVMLIPHVTQNGSLTVNGIQSDSCAFTVRAEPGAIEIMGQEGRSRADLVKMVESRLGRGSIDFIRSRNGGEHFVAFIKPAYADAAFKKFGVRAGKFHEVNLSNVVSQYGQKSTFKKRHFKILSCQEQSRVCRPQGDRNLLKGGSITAIQGIPPGHGLGSYPIKFKEVHAVGYPVDGRWFVTSQRRHNECPHLDKIRACGK